MAGPLFVFIQMEFPWVLGPADGRYLIRRGEDGEPAHVVVLAELASRRELDGGAPVGLRAPARRLRLPRRRMRVAEPEPEPVPVRTTRVTVIDPVSLGAERQARAWLAELDTEREVGAAVAVVNRVLHTHRIVSANPYLHELSASQALVIRGGWGEGEQVADGRWLHARELSGEALQSAYGGQRTNAGGWPRRERSRALRPQERLAALLGGRGRMLRCEELVLRARADLDQARPAHAALELERAYAVGVAELRAEERQDLAIRLTELVKLQEGVRRQGEIALTPDAEGLDEDVLAHALERLEAALRARTAAGVAR